MNLKNKGKTPDGGWKYFDPDTKAWIQGGSFDQLLQQVMLFRARAGLQNHNYLSQMIEDQICDRLPKEECEGRSFGDIVHAMAKPIAKVLDTAINTNFGGCGACAKRRAKLNS